MAGYNSGYPIIYPQMYYQPPVAYQAANQGQIPGGQTGILWVGSEQEAQSYPVAPNNAVALWDSTRPTVYLKQADASGKPSIKIYDLAERTESARVAISSPQNDKDTPYAKKSDVQALSDTVEDLRADLESFRKEITRKAKRREESENDE